jgi:hypothetical protein
MAQLSQVGDDTLTRPGVTANRFDEGVVVCWFSLIWKKPLVELAGKG